VGTTGAGGIIGRGFGEDIGRDGGGEEGGGDEAGGIDRTVGPEIEASERDVAGAGRVGAAGRDGSAAGAGFEGAGGAAAPVGPGGNEPGRGAAFVRMVGAACPGAEPAAEPPDEEPPDDEGPPDDGPPTVVPLLLLGAVPAWADASWLCRFLLDGTKSWFAVGGPLDEPCGAGADEAGRDWIGCRMVAAEDWVGAPAAPPEEEPPPAWSPAEPEPPVDEDGADVGSARVPSTPLPVACESPLTEAAPAVGTSESSVPFTDAPRFAEPVPGPGRDT